MLAELDQSGRVARIERTSTKWFQTTYARVEEWMGLPLPDKFIELERSERLYATTRTHRLRLEWLYEQAILGWRKSLEVSTRMRLPACSIRMETRSRLSRGSSDMHVSQSHAIDGTPVEVPVPRKVSFIWERGPSPA